MINHPLPSNLELSLRVESKIDLCVHVCVAGMCVACVCVLHVCMLCVCVSVNESVDNGRQNDVIEVDHRRIHPNPTLMRGFTHAQ
jgi:hypothetical protein